MGASTTAQLIARGKGENAYNNSGIATNVQWVDFFNDALRDLVEDIFIEKTGSISYATGTREYDLPTDYFSINRMIDDFRRPVPKRRYYERAQGYWVFNRGSKYVIDFYDYMSNQTFGYTYVAYPTSLTNDINAEYPDVQSVGEKALVYYAISKALKNNNQPGQAQDYEKLYEQERMKIRNAAAKGVN